MRFVVVGGGVIGMTSAYALLREGYDVTLIDSGDSDHGIASNVNAGLISPGHALPWASPAMLRRLPSVLANRTPQLRVRSHLDPALLGWGLRFIAECMPARSRTCTVARASLGARSRESFLRLLSETEIDVEVRPGMLFVHSDEDAMLRQFAALEPVRDAGPVLELLSRAETLAVEPALGASELPIAGAIHHPDGMTADCAAFVTALQDHCVRNGMTYLNGLVERLDFDRGQVVEVRVAGGDRLVGDNYVIAAGAHTRRLVRPHHSVPTYPVRGYGLTWSGISGEGLPQTGGVDESRLIAWSRTRQTLRVTGIAEFSAGSSAPVASDIAYVRRSAEQLFPAIAGLESPRIASGFRPVTPDGLPRTARVGENLFVNTGHGNLGWTMACGSAEVLVDVVSGRPGPDVRG